MRRCRMPRHSSLGRRWQRRGSWPEPRGRGLLLPGKPHADSCAEPKKRHRTGRRLLQLNVLILKRKIDTRAFQHSGIQGHVTGAHFAQSFDSVRHPRIMDGFQIGRGSVLPLPTLPGNIPATLDLLTEHQVPLPYSARSRNFTQRSGFLQRVCISESRCQFSNVLTSSKSYFHRTLASVACISMYPRLVMGLAGHCQIARRV